MRIQEVGIQEYVDRHQTGRTMWAGLGTPRSSPPLPINALSSIKAPVAPSSTSRPRGTRRAPPSADDQNPQQQHHQADQGNRPTSRTRTRSARLLASPQEALRCNTDRQPTGRFLPIEALGTTTVPSEERKMPLQCGYRWPPTLRRTLDPEMPGVPARPVGVGEMRSGEPGQPDARGHENDDHDRRNSLPNSFPRPTPATIRSPRECPPETTPVARSPRPSRLRLGHDVAAGSRAREQAVVVGEVARTGNSGVRRVGRLRQGCVGAAVFIPSRPSAEPLPPTPEPEAPLVAAPRLMHGGRGGRAGPPAARGGEGTCRSGTSPGPRRALRRADRLRRPARLPRLPPRAGFRMIR